MVRRRDDFRSVTRWPVESDNYPPTRGATPTSPIDEFQTVATQRIPPDPGILKAIGLGHSLEFRHSRRCRQRYRCRCRPYPHPVRVARRVDAPHLRDRQRARDGRRRDHWCNDPRHPQHRFRASGTLRCGSESASFSQASVLTVLSRKMGCAPEVPADPPDHQDGDGFECDVLDPHQVADALDGSWAGLVLDTGTVIRWDEIGAVPGARDAAVTNQFITIAQAKLRHHLGLTFHRLLEAAGVRVGIEVYDGDTGMSGATFAIDPINPFGYQRSGAPGYPKVLNAHLGDVKIPLTCHVWTPRSDSRLFKLDGQARRAISGVLFLPPQPAAFGGFVGGRTSGSPTNLTGTRRRRHRWTPRRLHDDRGEIVCSRHSRSRTSDRDRPRR